MTHHVVNTDERVLDSDDLASWVLFWIEMHGGVASLNAKQDLHVDLDPVAGLTAATADRLARVTVLLHHEIRAILLARRHE